MATTGMRSKSSNKDKIAKDVPLRTSPDYPEYQRQPTETPPFSVGDLKRAIPPHCFQRSTLRSFGYLFRDLLLVAILYKTSTFIPRLPLPPAALWLVWAVYWVVQGTVTTGLWVLAHECGHQAFSDSEAINDGVGFIVHSLLLVPYFSWKHSHRRHHSNTNSVDKDEVHVPEVRAEVMEVWSDYFAQLAIVRLGFVAGSVLVGWPMYLFFNVNSRPYDKLWVNHFDPWSPIFTKRERSEVVMSDVGLLAVLYGLSLVGKAWGWEWLIKNYVGPYIVVNFWLVAITLLQHTHPSVPRYKEAEWDWLRGALGTVDRSYGWIIDTLQHHIQDTHVAHHLFSTMPHYNAEEATKALKPILGKYYMRDERPFLQALWEDGAFCRYLAPDTKGEPVLWNRK